MLEPGSGPPLLVGGHHDTVTTGSGGVGFHVLGCLLQ